MHIQIRTFEIHECLRRIKFSFLIGSCLNHFPRREHSTHDCIALRFHVHNPGMYNSRVIGNDIRYNRILHARLDKSEPVVYRRIMTGEISRLHYCHYHLHRRFSPRCSSRAKYNIFRPGRRGNRSRLISTLIVTDAALKNASAGIAAGVHAAGTSITALKSLETTFFLEC